MKEFQGNQPLAPYLYERLQLILSNLLKRFIKTSVMNNLKSGTDFVKLDVKKELNLLSNKEVEIGFGAKRALCDNSGNGSVPSSVAVAFRGEAKEVLQTICAKIQERSPLKYSMTKSISSLSPSVIWSTPKVSSERFKHLCDGLIDANRISTATADKAFRSWGSLVSTEEFKSRAKEFARDSRSSAKKNSLDYFYKTELEDKPEFSEVYRIVKMILILSHGNAEVERGFSINKQVLKDNLAESSLIAQRLVHQAIPGGGKNFLEIHIDKKMIADVRMAWRRREQYLEAKRAEKTEEQRRIEQKKRRLTEISELEAKKKKISEETTQVLKTIDCQLNHLRK